MTAAVNLNRSRATRSSTQTVNTTVAGDNGSAAQTASPPVDGPTSRRSKAQEKSLREGDPEEDQSPKGGGPTVTSQAQHPASTANKSSSVQGAEVASGATVGPVPHPPQKKGAPTSERDSINALLSLGRDLHGSESEEQGAEDPPPTTKPALPPNKRPPPQPILPATLAAKPSKKRQKNNGQPASASSEVPNAQAGYKYPPDFWYWIPPGETVGEWDVLCGRGGESNNFIGNRKYRKMISERKPAYREIPLKQRKAKTAFVRDIVQHVNNCGGRFIDVDETTGQYYVTTLEKARKKTSQALRETKELKWLDLSENKERVTFVAKVSVCPYCNHPGHKTRIAKACLKHHEWLDANTPGQQPAVTENGDSVSPPTHSENAVGAILEGGDSELHVAQEIPVMDQAFPHAAQAAEVSKGQNGSNSIVSPAIQATHAANPVSTNGAQMIPQDGFIAI